MILAPVPSMSSTGAPGAAQRIQATAFAAATAFAMMDRWACTTAGSTARWKSRPLLIGTRPSRTRLSSGSSMWTMTSTIGHGALHSCREFTRGFGRGTGDLGNGAVIANQRLPRCVLDPRSRRPRAEHVYLDRTPMRGGVFLEGVQVFGQPGSGTSKSRLTCVAESPAADGGFDFERSIDTGQHGGRSPDGVTSRASTR